MADRRVPVDEELTEGSSQSRGTAVDNSGDGGVTKQVSGPDPRRTSERTAVGSADAMQSFVGGGNANEHEYDK